MNPPCKKRSQKSLAKFKLSKRVIFADELPRNAMGKLQKNLLREGKDSLARTRQVFQKGPAQPVLSYQRMVLLAVLELNLISILPRPALDF
jgi:hypothetical protein